jgi:two-component sensor histidine kinase
MRLLIPFLFIFSGIFTHFPAQEKTGPIAKFTFNNSEAHDEIGGDTAKLVGVNFSSDRFGNENNAVFISGNIASYINLGTDKALKPITGSISLWVTIENAIWSGTGIEVNPVLLTKSILSDDFYEAYSFYFEHKTNKLSVVVTKDSTLQVCQYSIKPIRTNRWYHMVLAYNDDSTAFYLNGQLQSRFPKKFKTQFLEGDSVLVGSTGNKKNSRYLKASVDDIEFYDRVLDPDEILKLYYAPDPNRNKVILMSSLAGVFLFGALLLLYFLIKYRIKKGIEKERQRLELHNKLLKTELRVNRASMNPHFLFNSLNALHNFILAGENDHASDYLLKFSKLIRKTLDSNMYDFISLEMEIELLDRYLEIENTRFEENIKYRIVTGESLTPASTHIPLMMLQPFVENAVWHGLLNKAGEKIINISFSLYETDYIYCIIEDNGSGRKNIQNRSSEKRSLATTFISQRLELLNKIHGLKCTLQIEDKPGQQGTIVKILLPILNK